MNLIFLVSMCLCFIALTNCAVPKGTFPSYITQCKRNADAFKCVSDNIERCKPHLAKGIPKLAMPPMNPLIVPSLDISSNNLMITMKDLKTYNLDQLEVTGGDIDFDKFSFHFKFHIPYLYNEFHYEAHGKILVLNFNGKGNGNVNASDVTINLKVNGRPLDKNGITFVEIENVDVDYTSKDGHFFLDNIFANQTELNEHTNKLINENFREFEDEISPDISKAVAALIKGIAVQVFGKFSYDELFPLE